MKNWGLEGVVESTHKLLSRPEYVIVYHSRREGNKVAIFLASMGCRYLVLNMDVSWPLSIFEEGFESLQG